VLDSEAPPFDAAVDGKAVCRASDRLRRLAAELGVAPLDAFIGSPSTLDSAD